MARKLRGPKMARSEVMSVRFDSKLMLATRLAAARERRSITSYIEWAVEQANRLVHVSHHWDAAPSNAVDTAPPKPISAMDVAEAVWEPDEAKRLMHLATMYPELLSHEEEVLWELIWNNTAFSRPRPKESGVSLFDPAVYVDWDAVHQHWDLLRRVAAGHSSRSELPRGKTIAESKVSLAGARRQNG